MAIDMDVSELGQALNSLRRNLDRGGPARRVPHVGETMPAPGCRCADCRRAHGDWHKPKAPKVGGRLRRQAARHSSEVAAALARRNTGPRAPGAGRPAKLSASEIQEGRRMLAKGVSVRDVARALAVSVATVSRRIGSARG